MRGWRILSVLLVLALTASTSFAAGFRLPEAGVKAMGMGFAFTAQADDPSAIYFNPAGLTQLKGQNVMVGFTYVREIGGEYTGTTPVDNQTAIKTETQKSLNFFIPNAYYTRTTNDGHISYGVGIFSPFGLGQEYKDKNSSIFRNQVTKIDLMTVVVNPTIAFKINEFLSVGAGIDYMYGKVKYDKTPVYPFGSFKTSLEGNGDAWGYNFGLLLKPSKNLKIGFNYRSPFHLKLKDGDFTAGDNTSAFPSPYSVLLPMGATKASGKLELPATAAIGIAYTMDRLTVEADADWTFWSSYKELKIVNDTGGPTSFYNNTAAKNWKDVCAVRVGAEYRVTDPLALRAGFVYDPTPVPASTLGPELPDATRLNYMVGAGYKVGPWTIDGAFMYIQKFDRTVANTRYEQQAPSPAPPSLVGQDGTWTGNAWLAGLDVGYRF